MDLDLKNYIENGIKNSFTNLINEIKSKYDQYEYLKISFKKINLKRDLIIMLKYKKKTKINPYRIEIIFYIELNQNFPDSFPYVRTLTNVNNNLFNYLNSLVY